MTEKTGVERIVEAVCTGCNYEDTVLCEKEDAEAQKCRWLSAIRKGVAEERADAIEMYALAQIRKEAE